MADSAAQWIDRLVTMLAEEGYTIEASPVGSSILATKKVRGMGPLFPVTDFVFLHRCTGETTAEEFDRWHQQGRAEAEGRFRLPRAMRYHIPHTVTVGVSDSGFDDALIAYATSPHVYSGIGGERHSVYLLDVAGRQMLSRGPEATPGRYGSRNTLAVNPINRGFGMMSGLFERLVGEG